VQYQRLGLSHIIGTVLDRGFVAMPTSTHNIACKPLPYVSASLGLLEGIASAVMQTTLGVNGPGTPVMRLSFPGSG